MENINHAIELMREQFTEGTIVWLILFGILLILSVMYFFQGIYIYKRLSVESSNFIVLCIPIVIWAFLIEVGPVLGMENTEGTLAALGIACVNLFTPSLIMLHIWSQVSYKPVTAGVRIRWLVVPVALTIIYAVRMMSPGFFTVAIGAGEGTVSIVTLVSNIYFIVVIVKSYLLCFNVFYQMPAHMRRSTYQLIIAISAITLAFGVSSFFGLSEEVTDILLAIAYIIAMYSMFTAFFIANSANVIVTSRDFVFSSLSTLVITVSLKGNILDWNHKTKDGALPLPTPKYKEPYTLYRQRILDTCNGTVSPHDENILNIKNTDGENNFLFTWHEICYFGRKFGYLIEIADVTNIYTRLRSLEGIAFFDNLTSLYNRNAYIDRVKQMASPDHMPLLIVVGDVNNLKKVNDLYGHLSGDKLLLTITGLVKEKAPENAFVARIGGDELVLLLSKGSDEEARLFISSVTEALKEVDDPEIGEPSISWGYAIMNDTTENYNDVFRAADAIMYQAKSRSREVTISGVVPQSEEKPPAETANHSSGSNAQPDEGAQPENNAQPDDGAQPDNNAQPETNHAS